MNSSSRLEGSNQSDKSNKSDRSDKSDSPNFTDRLLPPHGGYRKLRSFQTAELVYDGTVIFCDRFVYKYSRTHDQMVQAARSGRQNIAEGSMASATSKKKRMALRTSRKGRNAGQPFWGCTDYPECTGTRPAAPSSDSDRPGKSDGAPR